MADRYFERLEAYESLRTQAAQLEARIAQSEQEATMLRGAVRERAADAYRRAGTDLTAVLEIDDVNELMRTTKLLEVVNAEDGDAIDALTSQVEELGEQRSELRQLEEESARALDELQAARNRADANLQAALRDQQEVARRVAEQRARDAALARSTQQQSASPNGATTRRAAAAPTPAPRPAPSTGGTHPMHDHPFLACTRHRESRGNYSVVNPRGPWYGAYQFLQTTWNATANRAGRLELVGVVPSTASAYDQDDMAWTLYQWQGNRPWGGRC